ncbi:MAG: hypothetical protein HXY23_00325 [Parvularculaceae bacterium]|nr:hypothetical protein [Parvularculaceae bacterium]
MPNSSADEAARAGFVREYLNAPPAPSAAELARAIAARRPGAAVLLYGSGNSVLKAAGPQSVLYDFYAIVPSYEAAFASPLLRLAARVLPPNVFYLECDSAFGRLRCKYAVLSIDHFERLVSRRTFHSYFWARFAQPCRIVAAPEGLRARIERAILTSIDTFVANSAGLDGVDAGVAALWREGLARSYRAELRAEQPERVLKLLETYGDWPARVTRLPEATPRGQEALWRLRSLQGGLLSAARLLKASLTFEGGVDYIAWKISRHAGFDLPVRDWERKFPLLAAPILASRYYRLKRAARAK